MWILQQCKKSWDRAGLELSWDQISQAAAQAPAFKFRIDPDDSRFLNPNDMPSEIIEYCMHTNQPAPENYAEMARGVYESLAYSYQQVIEKLQRLTVSVKEGVP